MKFKILLTASILSNCFIAPTCFAAGSAAGSIDVSYLALARVAPNLNSVGRYEISSPITLHRVTYDVCIENRRENATAKDLLNAISFRSRQHGDVMLAKAIWNGTHYLIETSLGNITVTPTDGK
jgi:hypothetical protein